MRIAGGAQGYHGVDPFKLILVDLELPDGSGLELLEDRAMPSNNRCLVWQSKEVR